MERSENAAARHHHHGRTVGLMSEDGKREYDSESGRAAETRMSDDEWRAHRRSLAPSAQLVLAHFRSSRKMLGRTDGCRQKAQAVRLFSMAACLSMHARRRRARLFHCPAATGRRPTINTILMGV
jgi:hypothetical protein